MRRLLPTLLLLAALTACGNSTPEPATPPTITVTLSGIGSQVTYTCTQDGKVATCGPEPVTPSGARSSWTKKVTVPVGTVVRLAILADVLASCRITDETGRFELDANNTDGQCSAEAK